LPPRALNAARSPAAGPYAIRLSAITPTEAGVGIPDGAEGGSGSARFDDRILGCLASGISSKDGSEEGPKDEPKVEEAPGFVEISGLTTWRNDLRVVESD